MRNLKRQGITRIKRRDFRLFGKLLKQKIYVKKTLKNVNMEVVGRDSHYLEKRGLELARILRVIMM